jgi:hypothetical protein
MFDDTKEPEDMFEVTDKVAPQPTAPTDQPVVESAPTPVPAATELPVPHAAPVALASGLDDRIEQAASTGGFPLKAILLVVGILVVIGAAFLLSMRILGSRTPVTPSAPTLLPGDAAASSAPIAEEVEEVEEVEEAPTPIAVPTPSTTDTDKDGLTDEEEAELGTSPRAADTDGDGLFDTEEVRTWKTDPLNPDTDTDGYLDGEEVQGGYNPNGGGTLRELPNESS